jgi:hypothetical protein
MLFCVQDVGEPIAESDEDGADFVIKNRFIHAKIRSGRQALRSRLGT